ncbi:hypothetical protein M231_00009 [Tremella mesenterica]|uniref:HTH TFE/IIEalpha-type domain-containing protein n=1 Tax=Tremella mesenterica TaxID=5217 RepID=A0A4Q1BWB9_TREME|nr:hypothetical protein M231_00009 [Tremella mesenterica]
MSAPSADEVLGLCRNLVYQVAYAFYDAPYIILLRLMVHLGVSTEKRLAEICQLSPQELRKYMGMLLVHRLVKRHVGKEKAPVDHRRTELDPEEKMRIRDVIYWYLDYREFANVTKYRLAVMRRSIDDKVKNEVGVRGYLCPSCGRAYDPLDLGHLFDPQTNVFRCETCSEELVEHDPSQDDTTGDKVDRMGQFNLATAPIRDALKSLEGMTLPSVNIVAWMAQNVKSDLPVQATEGREEEKKVQIVLGSGGERERLEAERAAEAQRVQTSLPVWHTQSTITGQSTSLGLAAERKASGPHLAVSRNTDGGVDDLEEHYANLAGASGESFPLVKQEEEDEDEDDFLPSSQPGEPDESGPSGEDQAKMIMVKGVPKPLGGITEEDEAHMTPEEYQAYYEAIS